MQIDLVTASAQLINFLILVWLLKRFLFQPVLNVMKERESLIDSQLNEAALRMSEADVVEREHQRAIASLENEKASILANAVKETDDEKKRLMDEAREENTVLRKAWNDSLDAEKSELVDAFRSSIATSTCRVTDALLKKISNRSLNEQMLNSFIDQLGTLETTTKNKIQRNQSTLTMTTATSLSAPLKRKFAQSVHKNLEIDSPIDFLVDDSLIAGAQFNANGICLNWNIKAMLEDLEDDLSQVMENIGAIAH